MNKNMQSLLEIAIVIGGLAATPMFFLASF
jgi:hypothetical protein